MRTPSLLPSPLAALVAASLVAATLPVTAGAQTPPPRKPDAAAIIDAAAPADWRPLSADDTLVMTLPSGQVVIELAPAFAPNHATNIKALVREGYFDGLAILRVQDNYVTQWGDPAEDGSKEERKMKTAKSALAPEFYVPDAKGIPFTPVPGPDSWAPEVGFAGGFPAARNPKTGQAWLTHCYSMVGVARGGPETGSGAGLYTVIGHAPRALDRNITVVGRVVNGIEHLSALPRGTGRLGFYEKPEQRIPIATVRMMADLPVAERPKLKILRTDTPTWTTLVEARRNRTGDWWVEAQNASDVCNLMPPVRPAE